MRGNPFDEHIEHLVAGSIPACAGEPHAVVTTRCYAWVYPRVCGGTFAGGEVPEFDQGLSPRVRGNRIRLDLGLAHRGSIPACAGEPR